MKMSRKSRNRLEMLRGEVACEQPAKYSGCRAFAAIYPPTGDGIEWTVLRIEIPEELVDKYFSAAEIVESWKAKVKSLDEAEALLQEWGVDTSRLDSPWKCDYPL